MNVAAENRSRPPPSAGCLEGLAESSWQMMNTLKAPPGDGEQMKPWSEMEQTGETSGRTKI